MAGQVADSPNYELLSGPHQERETARHLFRRRAGGGLTQLPGFHCPLAQTLNLGFVHAKRFRRLSYGHPVLQCCDNTGPLCIHHFGARPYRKAVAYLIASLKRLSGLSMEATRLLKMHLEAGPLIWRIVGRT